MRHREGVLEESLAILELEVVEDVDEEQGDVGLVGDVSVQVLILIRHDTVGSGYG
jgi:hypothetical protein